MLWNGISAVYVISEWIIFFHYKIPEKSRYLQNLDKIILAFNKINYQFFK